jgi:hypothetical protein
MGLQSYIVLLLGWCARRFHPTHAYDRSRDRSLRLRDYQMLHFSLDGRCLTLSCRTPPERS